MLVVAIIVVAVVVAAVVALLRQDLIWLTSKSVVTRFLF